MRLSESRISHLSHLAYDALIKGGAAELLVEDTKLRREIKQAITRHLKTEDEVDDLVRKKVQSYSKKIIEGSPEWDVLYQKHYREEMDKRRRA